MAEDERVGSALRLVADALRPIVESEMSRAHGPRWKEAARGLRPGIDRGLDASALFATVQNNWQTVFAAKLGPMNRALIGELRETRNRWAHQEPFDASDVDRALDTAARFLKSVGSPLHQVVRRPSEPPPPSIAAVPAGKSALQSTAAVIRPLSLLESAFAAECGGATRRFGSTASGVDGVSDDAAGVQWNLTVHRRDGRATFGVNLEGMKYDGWPIARLLQRELDRSTLPELATSIAQATDIELVLWRDAWQASSRVKIEERFISPTPMALCALTEQGWRECLETARACLDGSKALQGRGLQTVTLAGRQQKVDRQVSPHLQFRSPLSGATSKAVRDARATLQPLYDWATARSRP